MGTQSTWGVSLDSHSRSRRLQKTFGHRFKVSTVMNRFIVVFIGIAVVAFATGRDIQVVDESLDEDSRDPSMKVCICKNGKRGIVRMVIPNPRGICPPLTHSCGFKSGNMLGVVCCGLGGRLGDTGN